MKRLIFIFLTIFFISGDAHPKSGDAYKDPVTGMGFVFVKGGCYPMGDTFGDGYANEKPVHEVCVDDFYMGKHEVTEREWMIVMGRSSPSYNPLVGCDDCPAEAIIWDEAQGFINELNQKAGKKYRLPTEAEWEYAARSGGKNEKFPGTNNIAELGNYAWYNPNSGSRIHSVGQKKPNGLGLYDMGGNGWEWVSDWYDENYYRNSPRDNPKGSNSGTYRVLRGGSWISGPGYMRASFRSPAAPTYRGSNFVIRLVLPTQ